MLVQGIRVRFVRKLSDFVNHCKLKNTPRGTRDRKKDDLTAEFYVYFFQTYTHSVRENE